LDHVKDVRRIEIYAGYRVVALGFIRLLLDAGDVAAAQLGDAEALGVVDLFENDEGIVRPSGRHDDEVGQTIVKNVVAEEDEAAGAAAVQLRQAQRLGDAPGLVLNAVSQVAAVLAAGAEQLDEIPHVLCTGYQKDVAHAGAHQLLERVVNHWVR